jgi:phosphoserine phosphatase
MQEYIVTLIAKPVLNLLNPEFLDGLAVNLSQNNIIITKQTTLAHNEAYDYLLKANSQEMLSVIIEDFIKNLEIDFFVQDAQNKRSKKLLVADMDSTLIENESLDEIARAIGKYKEISDITHQAMSGNTMFEHSLTKRVAMIAGTDVSLVDNLFDTVIKIRPGVKTLANTLGKSGTYLVIASGGFTIFSERLCKEIGFDEHYANVLEVVGSKVTGQLIEPLFLSHDKLLVMKKIMQEKNLNKEDVVAIGDGANDLPMLDHIPLGVAFKAKDIVNQQAKYKIRHNDIDSLLYVLGFKKEEFIK